jgi:CRP-like cAMP-binding protein
LTNKQKFALSNSIKEVKFKEGEIIFEAGEVSQGIYIISEGQVELTLAGRPTLLLK